MDDHQTSAAETVRTFLRLVEARDLTTAAEYLAADAKITFPGGRVFSSLEDQVRSSAGRFRSVRKTFDRFDVATQAGAGGESPSEFVIYAFGTLDGEGVDGEPFGGVRFVDRFTLRAGKIVDQMVWNDLAETGVV